MTLHEAVPIDVPARERLDRQALADLQLARLRQLLLAVWGRNPFYTRKLERHGIGGETLGSIADITALPFTTKSELVADQRLSPPWGTALTEPLERYTRYNHTSATTGAPLRWLDTSESWQWTLECWKAVYRAARVSASDRILFPFSFGPFLGFWTAFEAGCQIGAHCIPAGGLSSEARLGLVDAIRPTVLCCTPTYALRLLEVADETRPDKASLAESSVRVLIVAGEPGGSVPATRSRVERGWGARVIDHHGLTEVGPVSFECWENPGGIHLNECEFICEVLQTGSQLSAPDGTPGELVLTTLGRTASPVIRYRTGDIVIRRTEPCPCGRTLARAEGGILTRADDMTSVRGVNVYPTAIEAVVRRFAEVVEYRATVRHEGALAALAVDIEVTPGTASGSGVETRVAAALRDALGLHVTVHLTDPGALPRFEMKARRFIVHR